eukprot:CAMPEP_0119048588 /NCGR_PEP_ID=MMETSP1177-20130426/59707_1 /TAXON_ID=2985 /ORGANISM="Ochromonas sp, Strain CCMP1899" /LENGTH=98 /DNA_ID=CAMNT_0007024677 /DNA_START=184 /DNA_END=480 /DNA_ORIENTATION=-
MGQLNRAQKEKIAKENKRIAEGKLIMKRKLREAAQLLDIEMGLVSIQTDDNDNENENDLIEKEIEVGELKDDTIDDDDINDEVGSPLKSPSSEALEAI